MSSVLVSIPTDSLTSLQHRVARRADEIAQRRRVSGSLNLHCWLIAEAEIAHEVAHSLGAAAAHPQTRRP